VGDELAVALALRDRGDGGVTHRALVGEQPDEGVVVGAVDEL
jgi:hypothetical protein